MFLSDVITWVPNVFARMARNSTACRNWCIGDLFCNNIGGGDDGDDGNGGGQIIYHCHC